MKCPRCWSEKAYVSDAQGWRRLALACLFLVPMKCHHCYEHFTVSWFATLGKQVTPPHLRIVSTSSPNRQSYAARHYAATQSPPQQLPSSQKNESPRAKAA